MRGTLLLLGCALLCACAEQPVQVQVADGQLEGYLHEGVEHYLGVPYARPPIGDLRWRPPQPLQPWEGALRVQTNPDRCTQSVPVTNSLSGSEDCLYLNIWTPTQKPAAPMPVMVWIHGGANVNGSGITDGSAFARSGVVLVSVNYRLGASGFLHLEELFGEDYRGSANAALLDQVAGTVIYSKKHLFLKLKK